MHAFTLGLHNVVRWLVLLTGVVALLRCYRGLLTSATWTRREAVSVNAYTSTLSLEFLLGLFVYFLSPLGMRALGDMGAAMGDAEARFFALEHPITMLLSVACAHIALARARKATSDAGRFRSATILVTLSFLLLLVRMPWARPLFPSF